MQFLRLGGGRAAGNLPEQRREKGPQNHGIRELAKQFNSIDRGVLRPSVLLTANSHQRTAPPALAPRSCEQQPATSNQRTANSEQRTANSPPCTGPPALGPSAPCPASGIWEPGAGRLAREAGRKNNFARTAKKGQEKQWVICTPEDLTYILITKSPHRTWRLPWPLAPKNTLSKQFARKLINSVPSRARSCLRRRP